VGGVVPTATRFARYLRRRHKVYPKDLWKTQIVTLGSVPGINTRYRPALRALYGPVAIREIYGATECMFGQQRNEKKALRTRPNYDLFLFEVQTRSGVKMLHALQATQGVAGVRRAAGPCPCRRLRPIAGLRSQISKEENTLCSATNRDRPR